MSKLRTYDPAVVVRSTKAAADVQKLKGAPRNLKKYLPRYARRVLASYASSLPPRCAQRVDLSVRRVHTAGWGYLTQRLVNPSSCAFDGSTAVVVKATSGGKGRLVVNLGSGGKPDCDRLYAKHAPRGLVDGC